MCIEPREYSEGAPWDIFLTFRDPTLEYTFWYRRVTNLLWLCDRITYSLGIILSFVTYFKLQLAISTAVLLSIAPAFFCGCCLAWTFSHKTNYMRWRTECIVVMRPMLVLTISTTWVYILPPEASLSFVMARLVFNPTFHVLLSLNIGFQLQFRHQLLLQLVSVAIATYFVPLHCSAWFRDDSFSPLITKALGIIDSVVRVLWTWRIPSKCPENILMNGNSACWLVMCFIQWTVSVLSSGLLYCLESYSRVVFLLSAWEPDRKGRQNLWKFWREGIVMCCWTCLILSVSLYSVLNFKV